MATLLEVRGVHDIKDSANPLQSDPVMAFRDPVYPQYAVLSFNGKAKAFPDDPNDPDAAVGFAYDTTGEDPDFYFLVPGHDVIHLVKGVDFSGLKQGLGMPIMTTAERDASDEYFGRVVLNSTTKELNYSDGLGAWKKPTNTPA